MLRSCSLYKTVTMSTTATVVIRHEVKDFNTWKSVFDAVQPLREASGELGIQLYRTGNTVLAVADYASLEQAQAYFGGAELKQKMGQAGVIGIPEINFVERV
jgi:hypothetical protein